MDTLIARIRSKVPEHTAGIEFKSVYGIGYMINERKQEE